MQSKFIILLNLNHRFESDSVAKL